MASTTLRSAWSANRFSIIALGIFSAAISAGSVRSTFGAVTPASAIARSSTNANVDAVSTSNSATSFLATASRPAGGSTTPRVMS